MNLPPHVLQALVDAGHVTERLTSRKAKPRRCRRCGRGVLSGLDGDVLAFDVDADPIALTPSGEVGALLAGRRTYALRTAGRPELDRRLSPHRSAEAVVVPEHDCGWTTPTAWRAPAPRTAPAPPTTTPF